MWIICERGGGGQEGKETGSEGSLGRGYDTAALDSEQRHSQGEGGQWVTLPSLATAWDPVLGLLSGMEMLQPYPHLETTHLLLNCL